jgi:hypothetical protein
MDDVRSSHCLSVRECTISSFGTRAQAKTALGVRIGDGNITAKPYAQIDSRDHGITESRSIAPNPH